MSDRTCSVDGCDKPHAARGWCDTHYRRWYNAPGSGVGDLMVIVNIGECTIEGCTKDARYRGWCSTHYGRFQRLGDPLAIVESRSAQGGQCAVDGCKELSQKRGWCAMHYRRWQRNGDPESVKLVRRLEDSGSCEQCGTQIEAGSRSRFCGGNCRVASRRKATWRPLSPLACCDCGVEFERRSRLGPSAGPRRCDGCTFIYQQAQDREHTRRRRARMANVLVEKFSDAEIFERDGWVCGICCGPVDAVLGHPDPMSKSIDHVIPISKGGHHSRANVQLAHLTCNVHKQASLNFTGAAMA